MYAAAGALVYINKFAMSICLSVCLFRYVFGRASTYGAETWHGGRVWRAGGNCPAKNPTTVPHSGQKKIKEIGQTFCCNLKSACV